MMKGAAAGCVVWLAIVVAGCGRGTPDEASANVAAPKAATTDAGTAGGSTTPAPAAVKPEPAIAEATSAGAPLTVQVLSAKRITADTLRLDFALINTSASRASPANGQTADGQAASGQAAAGPTALPFTAVDLCLLTSDGMRRLFVLRDPADKPVTGGSFDPLEPGERRLIWAMFPSPAVDAASVSLQMGANLILRDVPVAPLSAAPLPDGAAAPPTAPASTPVPAPPR